MRKDSGLTGFSGNGNAGEYHFPDFGITVKLENGAGLCDGRRFFQAGGMKDYEASYYFGTDGIEAVVDVLICINGGAGECQGAATYPFARSGLLFYPLLPVLLMSLYFLRLMGTGTAVGFAKKDQKLFHYAHCLIFLCYNRAPLGLADGAIG